MKYREWKSDCSFFFIFNLANTSNKKQVQRLLTGTTAVFLLLQLMVFEIPLAVLVESFTTGSN